MHMHTNVCIEVIVIARNFMMDSFGRRVCEQIRTGEEYNTNIHTIVFLSLHTFGGNVKLVCICCPINFLAYVFINVVLVYIHRVTEHLLHHHPKSQPDEVSKRFSTL